jgi:hypothetical protein
MTRRQAVVELIDRRRFSHGVKIWAERPMLIE